MTVLRTPVENLVMKISPNDIQRQIANAHTLFNLLNVLIQLPFAGLLVKAANAIVTGDDEQEVKEAKFLDFRIIETPTIALGQVRKEIMRMAEYVQDNLARSKAAIADEKFEEIENVLEQEQKINRLQREITDYLVRLSNAPISDEEHGMVNIFLYVINDIERVGDHAENLVELAEEKRKGNLKFTEEATEEMHIIFSKCEDAFRKAAEAFAKDSIPIAKEVLILEDQVDNLETQYRSNHISRLNQGLCQTSPGIVFLDAISNLERVADHAYNIALYVLDKEKKKL